MKNGSAASWSTTEKTIKPMMDLSYNHPIPALPANHATPKTVSNTPKAVLRLSGGTTPLSMALSRESCAPMPMPHRIIPTKASANPPRKTHGAKKAPRKNASTTAGNPSLSSNLPNTSAASALVTIAAE